MKAQGGEIAKRKRRRNLNMAVTMEERNNNSTQL